MIPQCGSVNPQTSSRGLWHRTDKNSRRNVQQSCITKAAEFKHRSPPVTRSWQVGQRKNTYIACRVKIPDPSRSYRWSLSPSPSREFSWAKGEWKQPLDKPIDDPGPWFYIQCRKIRKIIGKKCEEHLKHVGLVGSGVDFSMEASHLQIFYNYIYRSIPKVIKGFSRGAFRESCFPSPSLSWKM